MRHELADSLWASEAYAQLRDIGTVVDHSSRRFGDAPYILPAEPEATPLSFRHLESFIRGFEVFLERQGVSSGDRCVVISNNSTTLILQFLAIMALDRIFVPINPHASANDIAFIIDDCDAKVVIFDNALEEKVRFLADRELIPFEQGSDFIRMVTQLSSERPEPASAPTADSIAEIVYTSGSTGRPKGVELTHRNLLADMFGIGQVFDFAPATKFLTVTPLFHNSGQIMTTLIPLYCGGVTTAIRPDMGFINFWHYVDLFQPEWTLVMPAHVALMLDRSEAPSRSTLQGILCGGAKLEPKVHADFERRFAVTIYPNYGLTESASIATCARPDDTARASGSVGRPLDINKVRLVNGGREAAAMEIGEIWISGDNVFKGYVGLPELYARKVQDGWLHTGDLGFQDANGYIHIVDRIDSMVIVGGENVYPSEIERFVPDLAGINEAYVLSVPDRIMGRELVLVYKMPQGTTPNEKAWKSHLFSKLTRFKVPRRFVDVKKLGLEDFPRSPNGKLLRKVLQDSLESHLCPELAGPGAMSRSSTHFRQLATVIADVMEIDEGSVHEDLHMDHVPSWDSLNHLRLMVTLGDAFGLYLSPARMAEMTSVPAILRVLDDSGRSVTK